MSVRKKWVAKNHSNHSNHTLHTKLTRTLKITLILSERECKYFQNILYFTAKVRSDPCILFSPVGGAIGRSFH
jgi:hypothetical protein